MGPAGVCQGAREVDREAGYVAAPLIAPWLATIRRRAKSGAPGQPLDAGLRKRQPGGDIQRQFDRRAREVEVGSVEHAQLDHDG